MPNLRPLPSLESLLSPTVRPVYPATPLPRLSGLTPLKTDPLRPQPPAPLKPLAPLQPFKTLAADRVWSLQAAINILQNDSDGDGQLNPDEYKSVSLIQGDSYFSSAARDYEFATIDEIKLSDGKISMGELTTFYQEMDTDKNGSHSQSEFANRLNRSSWLTRIRNPVAAFSQTIGQYTHLVKDFALGS